MNRETLFTQITAKGSFLCIGLDSDMEKLPPHLLNEDDPIFEFNKAIVNATKEYCVAYKLNLAFYEEAGINGWEAVARTLEIIPPGILTIADGKRADIGNTSKKYARALFETYGFGAATVSPYMGEDSVMPFLDYKDKWTILLALTSNPGSMDFQFLELGREQLYENVIRRAMTWGSPDNLMFVAGATHAGQLREIRSLAPGHFLLVPGIGAQGGSLEAVADAGMNQQCGLLVNASRSIIFAGDGEDFADKAAAEARRLRDQMKLRIAAPA